MSNLLDGIKNYLNMDNTGALMVTGDWGCGKSYHVDHVVFPGLEEEGFSPIKVSLFGIESVNDIPLRIAENYKGKTPSVEEEEKEGENTKKRGWFSRNKEKATEAIAKGSQALASVTWLSNFIDLKSLLSKYSDLLYKLIPTDNTVIFLDDMERVIDTIDTHTLLGAINGLVEQRGYKVVVIANNAYIQEKEADRLVFKEKVIEKTLVYDPDVVAVYKEICERSYEKAFTDFMFHDKAIFVIDPNFIEYKEDDGLQTDLHNIRIIKFALAHFHQIFMDCSGFLAGEEKTISEPFLFALWASTVGLSIEYKKSRLTYKDREQFVQYVDLSSIGFELPDDNEQAENIFEEEKDETEVAKKEAAQKFAYGRVNYVIKRIVKKHNLPVIIAPQVFDFVTAGVSLDKTGLKKVWNDYKAQLQRNTQSPAYALLDRFLKSQWDFSNEEMVEALAQLAKYVEEGAYSDNISYVNAATYLQHMVKLTPYKLEDLHKLIIKGIDRFYSRVTSIGAIDKVNLDVTKSEIPEMSQWVVEYEKQKMETVVSKAKDVEIKEVRRQFDEDLLALEKRLTIQYGSTKTPDFVDFPILSFILYDDIVKKVNVIQPKEVMALYDIINTRFQQMVNPKIYDIELQFVENLYHALENRKPEKMEYSDILIEDHLRKLVKKVLKI